MEFGAGTHSCTHCTKCGFTSVSQGTWWNLSSRQTFIIPPACSQTVYHIWRLGLVKPSARFIVLVIITSVTSDLCLQNTRLTRAETWLCSYSPLLSLLQVCCSRSIRPIRRCLRGTRWGWAVRFREWRSRTSCGWRTETNSTVPTRCSSHWESSTGRPTTGSATHPGKGSIHQPITTINQ